MCKQANYFSIITHTINNIKVGNTYKVVSAGLCSKVCMKEHNCIRHINGHISVSVNNFNIVIPCNYDFIKVKGER